METNECTMYIRIGKVFYARAYHYIIICEEKTFG